jgi:hypothetical protein
MRNLEYACLGFPNNWYKVDDSLMNSKYFKPLLVRDSETKEIVIDNRGKSDADSLSTYDYFNPVVKKSLMDFIKSEEEILWERKRKWLKEKGDISFFNLNSIQGQLGLLDRLKEVIKENNLEV